MTWCAIPVWPNKQADENGEESEPSDPEDETTGHTKYEAGRGNDSDIELSSEESEVGSCGRYCPPRHSNLPYLLTLASSVYMIGMLDVARTIYAGPYATSVDEAEDESNEEDSADGSPPLSEDADDDGKTAMRVRKLLEAGGLLRTSSRPTQIILLLGALV